MVLDKSGSVASAQSSILAFARDMVDQFALDAAVGAQIGLVEFANDAKELTPLTALTPLMVRLASPPLPPPPPLAVRRVDAVSSYAP